MNVPGAKNRQAVVTGFHVLKSFRHATAHWPDKFALLSALNSANGPVKVETLNDLFTLINMIIGDFIHTFCQDILELAKTLMYATKTNIGRTVRDVNLSVIDLII